MIVKSVKGEFITINNLDVFTLRDNILSLKENGRTTIYTLTDESRERLDEYLKSVK